MGPLTPAFIRQFYGEVWMTTTDKTEESTDKTEENAAAAEEAAAGWKTFAEGIEQVAVKLREAQGALKDMVTPFETIGRNQDALEAVFDLGNAPEIAAGQVRDIKHRHRRARHRARRHRRR